MDDDSSPAPQPTAGDHARGRTARDLLHSTPTASLATAMAPDAGAGAPDEPRPDAPEPSVPYASLVAHAPDMAGAPLLLLSDLAQHTRNLAADPRACLLVDGTAGYAEPLAGPRVSLQGRLRLADTPANRARYLRWQPAAAQYAALTDFRLYRLEPQRAHLVAGFGKVHWLPPASLHRDIADAGALIQREAAIVAHMNADHLDALADIAGALTGTPRPDDGAWTLAGVDPEGADLASGRARLRLHFAARVRDPDGCRRELVRATQNARKRDGN